MKNVLNILLRFLYLSRQDDRIGRIKLIDKLRIYPVYPANPVEITIRGLVIATAFASLAVAEPRVETVRQNGVTLTITFDPGSVSLDRDIILSLKLTHPESIAVTLPPLSDRLEGLLAASSFDREAVPADDKGNVTRERIVRLTPLIADEYRLAPMAIATRHAVDGNGKTDYFATPPIVCLSMR